MGCFKLTLADKYKLDLEKKVRKIDKLLNADPEYELFFNAITHEDNEHAIIELLKQIGDDAKNVQCPITKKDREELSELLFSYIGAKKVDELVDALKEDATVPLDALLKQLDELVGLEEVKQQIRDLITFHSVQQLRLNAGLKKTNKTLHLAFLGNPGTAKTTVARIVGHMYKSIGLLSKGHFIEASRTDLIAEYQGQTAIKVKRLINKAKGGVLFIDEAYSLTENDHSDSYGKESLTELTKALEDYRDDLVVIVAGYSNLMEQFFESNPGLKSRFNTFIQFNDYSVNELVDIFSYIAEQNDYFPTEEAISAVRSWVQNDYEHRSDHYGNGRVIRNLFDDIIVNQAKRLSSTNFWHGQITREMLTELLPEDVPVIIE